MSDHRQKLHNSSVETAVPPLGLKNSAFVQPLVVGGKGKKKQHKEEAGQFHLLPTGTREEGRAARVNFPSSSQAFAAAGTASTPAPLFPDEWVGAWQGMEHHAVTHNLRSSVQFKETFFFKKIILYI